MENQKAVSEFVVLIPAGGGAYDARIFASKKEVRKILSELPGDAVFFKGRRLAPKTKVTITL